VKKLIQRWLQDKIGIGQNRDQIKILENKIASLSLLFEWSSGPLIQIPLNLIEKTKESLKENYHSVNFQINRNDPMFRYPLQVQGALPLKILQEYFYTGAEAADYIYKQAPNAKNILDFGCGYGRVSRFLKICFPDAKLLVSDPKNSAIDFQVKNLNTISDDNSPVDLIFAGSVFTHLPKNLFQKTLHQLMKRLNSGGCLILTLHPFIDNDFSIYPYTEESTLTGLEDPIDSEVYGSVYCSKEFFEFCVYSHVEGNKYECSFDNSSSYGGTQQYIILKYIKH
tara:strand:- start:3980 stop:4825 length:846 start_codon:yes stop_codon:yes gene_type:complete